MNKSQLDALDHLAALGEQLFTFMDARIKNAWKENGEPTAEKQAALDDIIQAYRNLFGFHIDAARGVSAYDLLQRAMSIQGLVDGAPATIETIETVDCEYCQGHGSTGIQLAMDNSGGTRIPCIGCDGTGKVLKDVRL